LACLETVSNDYALMADVARALSCEYAYDKERAAEVIAEEMEAWVPNWSTVSGHTKASRLKSAPDPYRGRASADW
jgi:hypothetical protein